MNKHNIDVVLNEWMVMDDSYGSEDMSGLNYVVSIIGSSVQLKHGKLIRDSLEIFRSMSKEDAEMVFSQLDSVIKNLP